MTEETRNSSLLALAGVLAVLGLATLLPVSSSKTSDLGYASLCPFAPWSSLALLLAAGLVWAVRRYLMEQSAKAKQASLSEN
ncbi:MAG: hypothetical protein ABSB35_24495 [Bryobacteraceae bacterium]